MTRTCEPKGVISSSGNFDTCCAVTGNVVVERNVSCSRCMYHGAALVSLVSLDWLLVQLNLLQTDEQQQNISGWWAATKH